MRSFRAKVDFSHLSNTGNYVALSRLLDLVRSKNSSEAPPPFMLPPDGKNARVHPVARGIEQARRGGCLYLEGTAIWNGASMDRGMAQFLRYPHLPHCTVSAPWFNEHALKCAAGTLHKRTLWWRVEAKVSSACEHSAVRKLATRTHRRTLKDC